MSKDMRIFGRSDHGNWVLLFQHSIEDRERVKLIADEALKEKAGTIHANHEVRSLFRIEYLNRTYQIQ